MAGEKKRGRPPLSSEERAKKASEHSKQSVERHKNTGYAAQKKYRALHPDRVRAQAQRYYEPKVRIPITSKPVLDELLASTGKTISELFIGAVEEKYGVAILKPVDNNSGS